MSALSAEDIRKNTDGYFAAMENNDADKAKESLDKGIDIHSPCPDGIFHGLRPLHVATWSGVTSNFGIIEDLLLAGADIDATAFNSKITALRYSIINKQWRNYKFLLDHGADPFVKDYEGHTIMDTEDRARSIYKQHCERCADEISATIAGHDDIRAFLIDDEGHLTNRGRVYIHAHVLPEIFNPKHWKGKAAEGLQLYEDLAAAIPDHLKSTVVPQLDITGLRRAAAQADVRSPAVARYVRPKATSLSEGRS